MTDYASLVMICLCGALLVLYLPFGIYYFIKDIKRFIYKRNIRLIDEEIARRKRLKKR